RDTTGGLNRNGEVVLHVPRGHVPSQLGGKRAAWLRCRVLEAQEGQPTYSASPMINRLVASTIGGTTVAVNAEIVRDEVVGVSDGTPGQRFHLRRSPVVPGEEPVILEVTAGEGWEGWTPDERFAHCLRGARRD